MTILALIFIIAASVISGVVTGVVLTLVVQNIQPKQEEKECKSSNP